MVRAEAMNLVTYRYVQGSAKRRSIDRRQQNYVTGPVSTTNLEPVIRLHRTAGYISL